jgi:chromate reductase
MRVLGISGSLRQDSHNTKLLRAAAELLPSGAELVIWEDLKAVPPYDADDDSRTRSTGSRVHWRRARCAASRSR